MLINKIYSKIKYKNITIISVSGLFAIKTYNMFQNPKIHLQSKWTIIVFALQKKKKGLFWNCPHCDFVWIYLSWQHNVNVVMTLSWKHIKSINDKYIFKEYWFDFVDISSMCKIKGSLIISHAKLLIVTVAVYISLHWSLKVSMKLNFIYFLNVCYLNVNYSSMHFFFFWIKCHNSIFSLMT